ncbi:unnamed protein product, partial [Ceratitis capitata]
HITKALCSCAAVQKALNAQRQFGFLAKLPKHAARHMRTSTCASAQASEDEAELEVE